MNDDDEEVSTMGAAARKGQEAALAALDKIIGPAQSFNVYRYDGCPKCGALAEHFNKRWCPGNDVPGAAGPCRAEGQHLHVMCPACQFQWREETADAERERDRLAASLLKS